MTDDQNAVNVRAAPSPETGDPPRARAASGADSVVCSPEDAPAQVRARWAISCRGVPAWEP